MSTKEATIEVTAKVLEVCRNGLCVLEILPDSKNTNIIPVKTQIKAILSGKIRKYRIKIVAGDTVTVEVSPYNLDLGRITFRAKNIRPTENS